MAPFSKPETVLKQAEGLVSVGQTHAALQSLTEMFSSKRFRSTPLASLEPIMLRFVELCVDMRKGRTAKEGLMQYKNIAQNTSVQSIDVVITRFVQLADAKVREAQEKAAVQVAVDVDDLEASETPESILLGAVSGDQSRDRTDRALVTPWLKFLWESYRTSLETLKNNARLEAIYQQIAQQAFKFCLKHTRKVEFRRLCETLRLHLANVAKYSHQPHSINLSDPDTLQHHLDTRFAQLHTSVELELWQEAFRSVEDVHNLLTMAKKTPRPAMMATYYEKLTRIFLMSGNALYHAAAWGRYYAVVVGMGGGGRSEEEMARLAGQVLVSALAVPVGMQVEEIAEEGKTRTSRLTALLGLSRTPTRAGLLKDAISRSILPLSPPTIQSLYSTLEASFSPLTLCAQTTPLLLSLAQTDAYAPYVPLLQRALLSRLLAQLAQVYSVVRIDMVLELTRPLEELRGVGLAGATETGSETAAEGAQLDPTKKLTSFAFDAEGVQAYAMGCARRGELNVRVDHARGCIEFVDEAFAGVGEGSSVSASASGATIGVGRDASVQPSTADVVRTRLSKLAVCLHDSLIAIDRSAGGAVSEVHAAPTTNESTTVSTTALISAALAERRALHLRRALTARRRELVSELSVRKEKEETSRRAEASRREKEDEERRALEDMRRREVERARSQYESVQKEEAKKLARKLAEGGLKGVVLDDMENLNTDTLLSLQVSQLEKEKKDLNERLRIAAKRVDHIERAYRKEELPLLAQDYAQQQSSDRDTFLAIQVTRREGHRRSHEQDVEAKRRLVRMVGDWEGWREVVLGRRGEAYERRRQEARRRMEEEMEKRKKSVLRERAEEKRRVEEEERERREKREEEERLEAERLAEVERKRAEEEAALEAAAAKKREEEEKIAAVRREREEARAKADEMARLQAKREEEAEKRARERFAGGAGGARAPQTPAAGGVWRSSRVASAASGTPTPAAGGFASSRASLASPARPESPNAGAGEAPRKYVPGAFKREAAARSGSGSQAPPPRTESPQPRSVRKEEPKGDDDGFQKVPEKQVWRATRR